MHPAAKKTDGYKTKIYDNCSSDVLVYFLKGTDSYPLIVSVFPAAQNRFKMTVKFIQNMYLYI